MSQRKNELSAPSPWDDILDDVVLENKRLVGVRFTQREGCDDSDYPTREHRIWETLQRRLSRKSVGEDICDVYFALDQLGLVKRLASAQSPMGPIVLEVVSLGDDSPIYVIQSSPESDPGLIAVLGDMAHAQALDVAFHRFRRAHPTAVRHVDREPFETIRVSLTRECRLPPQ